MSSNQSKNTPCDNNTSSCPPPVFAKPSTSFGGNNNIPTYLNTKAFRYSQLVSLPFTSRGSGTVIIINDPNATKPPVPPRNRF